MPADDSPLERWLVLEATPLCNLGCIYCCNPWTALGEDRPAPPEDTAYEILERLGTPSSFRGVTISGGEPALRPDLSEIVRKASKIAPEVFLATNGTLIDARLAKSLADAGLTGFQISLPAASGSTFEAICGHDALRDAMHGISAAAATSLPVSAAFTVCSLNSAEAGDALQMAFALGASSFQLTPLAPGGRATRSWKDVAPSRDQMKLALDLACRTACTAGVRIYTGIVLPPCEWPDLIPDAVENGGCLGAGPKWAVDPWGEVRPCEQVGVGLGSILSRDFESIAVSDEAQRFRRSIHGQGCTGCESLRSCRGGCRAYGSGDCGTRPSVEGGVFRGEQTPRG